MVDDDWEGLSRFSGKTLELCWASFGHVVVLEVGKLVFLREMSAHIVLCSRVSLLVGIGWGCWRWLAHLCPIFS